MVFGFVIGTYFEYFLQLKMLLLIPIAFLVAFNQFPESPEFLLRQQKKTVSTSINLATSTAHLYYYYL